MYPTIFTIIILLIGSFGFWFMAKDSNRIHSDLREFKKKAEDATTEKELRTIKTDLVNYNNRHCWHRHHGTHAKEVYSFISGKMWSMTIKS